MIKQYIFPPVNFYRKLDNLWTLLILFVAAIHNDIDTSILGVKASN